MDDKDALAEARAAYEAKIGKKPFMGWDLATLQAKMAEADGAGGVDPVPTRAPMLRVRLLKHYRPTDVDSYRVIGDPPPPPYPGVGFEHKLWAGTLVELPLGEARKLIENHTETAEFVLDGDGHKVRDQYDRPVKRTTRQRFPLAERADAYTVTTADGRQDAA